MEGNQAALIGAAGAIVAAIIQRYGFSWIRGVARMVMWFALVVLSLGLIGMATEIGAAAGVWTALAIILLLVLVYIVRRQPVGTDSTKAVEMVFEHHVLMDGEKNSGKSEFVRGLTRPSYKAGTIATAGEKEERLVLDVDALGRSHCLVFCDLPGEHQESIQNFLQRRNISIVVLVIDPCNVAGAVARFTRGRNRLAYRGDSARSVRHFVVYVSKKGFNLPGLDLLGARQLADRLAQELREDTQKAASVFEGDAVTGEQMRPSLQRIANEIGWKDPLS